MDYKKLAMSFGISLAIMLIIFVLFFALPYALLFLFGPQGMIAVVAFIVLTLLTTGIYFS